MEREEEGEGGGEDLINSSYLSATLLSIVLVYNYIKYRTETAFLISSAQKRKAQYLLSCERSRVGLISYSFNLAYVRKHNKLCISIRIFLQYTYITHIVHCLKQIMQLNVHILQSGAPRI